MRALYTACLYVLLPFVLVWLAWKNRVWLLHLGERWGFGRYPTNEGIWLHAASVGEVQAAVPLVRVLRDRYPALALTVTTGTPQGRARAIQLFRNEAVVRYLPFDLPASTRRFCAGLRPQLAIVLETELWPNLYHACRCRQIPLVLASARMSALSLKRYGWLARLFAETMSGGVVVAAQSAVDAERFLRIGANPARTHITGNVKLDLELPPDVVDMGHASRVSLGETRPVWIAGSTHPGEEELVLAAHAAVRVSQPLALLVLAPRKPERFATVEALLRKRHARFVTHTSRAPVALTTEVLLLDTLGELPQFYAASDVAFVGGSLVPAGGHNLLEPAALMRPILTGPHNENAADIARLFIEAGAAHVVRNEGELAKSVARYLARPELRELDGSAAFRILNANRGALARLMVLVEPLLAQQEMRRAA